MNYTLSFILSIDVVLILYIIFVIINRFNNEINTDIIWFIIAIHGLLLFIFLWITIEKILTKYN